MSNYTQTTFFTPKDTLPVGNPAKTIFGAAFDTEFGNIVAAVNSKQDQYFFVDSGAVNAMVITPNPAYGAYVTGMTFSVKVGNTTTATPVTLNVNGLGAKNITNTDASAVSIGQLVVGMVVTVTYDGTQFQVQSSQNTAQYGATTFIGPASGNVHIVFKDSGGTVYGNIEEGAPAGSGLNIWSAQNISIFCTTSTVTIGANNANAFKVNGQTAPTVQAWGPINNAMTDLTPDTGTFTMTYNGFTAGVTGTASWSRIGKLVTLVFPIATGTSNATTFTATGIPTAIQPSLVQMIRLPEVCVEDNTTFAIVPAVLTNGATFQFLNNNSGSGWTAAGTKGIRNQLMTITYTL